MIWMALIIYVNCASSSRFFALKVSLKNFTVKMSWIFAYTNCTCIIGKCVAFKFEFSCLVISHVYVCWRADQFILNWNSWAHSEYFRDNSKWLPHWSWLSVDLNRHRFIVNDANLIKPKFLLIFVSNWERNSH